MSGIGLFRVERLGVARARSDPATELARLLAARVLLLPDMFLDVCSWTWVGLGSDGLVGGSDESCQAALLRYN